MLVEDIKKCAQAINLKPTLRVEILAFEYWRDERFML